MEIVATHFAGDHVVQLARGPDQSFKDGRPQALGLRNISVSMMALPWLGRSEKTSDSASDYALSFRQIRRDGLRPL
jgi:hypothetical protein